jgi:hypothetical protein
VQTTKNYSIGGLDMVHAQCHTCFKEGLETFFFLGIEMNAHIIVGHAKDRQFSSTNFEKKKN